ncbi:hypothetical protein V1520DRAFT_330828 [Lipomyces starkeyi]
MEAILNFDLPVDVDLLDKVVDAFYKGPADQQKAAQQVLTQFQEHPDAWTRVDQILQKSNNPQTKYIALSILDKLIKTRWKALPVDQQQGMCHY